MTYRAQWKTLRTSRRRTRSLTCVYSANSTWKDGGWFKSNAVEGETIAAAIIKRKEKIKVKPLTFLAYTFVGWMASKVWLNAPITGYQRKGRAGVKRGLLLPLEFVCIRVEDIVLVIEDQTLLENSGHY